MPKVHADNYMALGERKPKTSTASRGSWWLNPKDGDFYGEARARYPESGTAHIDRSKVQIWGTDSKTLGARMRDRRSA